MSMIKPVLILTLLFAGAVQFSNKRLLLIYAYKSANAQLVKQKQLLENDQPGLKERDIEVRIYIRQENPKAFADKHIKEPFTVILIGKDGSEKLRMQEVLTLKKLYGTIDAMPMRKEETKKL